MAPDRDDVSGNGTGPAAVSWSTRPPSPINAWFAVVLLSMRRQAQMRLMVWLAVGLLGAAILVVAPVTAMGGWKFTDRRLRPTGLTGRQNLLVLEQHRLLVARVEPAAAVYDAVIGCTGAALDHSGFVVFTRWVVFAIFQTFLLPLWTLSFAGDALGSERENRTLIWLLTRPMPRAGIYLAKYVAGLPWCLTLNLVGFAAICLTAGEVGRAPLRLFWPAVFWGTLAFAALFHLLAAGFRRPTIVGLIYAFFFEVLVAELPGDLKRISLSFYVRSLMFEATRDFGVAPDQLSVYNPVNSWTAWGVLVSVTAVLLILGMIVFSRSEYREDV